jgi:acetoin:2,6-dichlorophenolindophenol oxidoreductase subunit beta
MPWTKIQADTLDWEKPSVLKKNGRMLSYRDAIREALDQALKIDRRVFVAGEGVDDPAGVFGTTKDLHKKYGCNRVFDLPLAENGFTGIAVGAAIAGMRPVLVHMRNDFLLLSMDQIINHASKWRYMCGGRQNVPLTIRAIIGRGWGSAAQHSQSLQGLFMHIPGLKIAVPSNAYDAKGLLLAGIAGEDPVMFIEHRWLYEQKEIVPEKPYTIPFGSGAIKRKGKDATIIAVSYMVMEALRAAEDLEKQGIETEVIDVRTLKPLDETLVLKSAKKTGRVVIADMGWHTGGAAAEISALICEKAFGCLKAPIVRVTLPDTPTPASPVLEKAFYPDFKKIISAVKGVIK